MDESWRAGEIRDGGNRRPGNSSRVTTNGFLKCLMSRRLESRVSCLVARRMLQLMGREESDDRGRLEVGVWRRTAIRAKREQEGEGCGRLMVDEEQREAAGRVDGQGWKAREVSGPPQGQRQSSEGTRTWSGSHALLVVGRVGWLKAARSLCALDCCRR